MTRAARTGWILAGLLLLAGGTLQAAAHRSTFSATVDRWPYQVGAWATVAGGCGLAVLAARWFDTVGSIPAAVAAAGSALLAALAFSEASVNPALVDAAPKLLDDRPGTTMLVGLGIATVGFAVGWVVFGIALLRRSGRSAPAIAVLVAAVLSLVPMIPGPAVLGLTLVWLATSSAAAPDLPERPRPRTPA